MTFTGKALADQMFVFIRNQPDPPKLHNQAYDGVGTKSGKTNGAATRISAQDSPALYNHCTSHCLNLAVVA